VNIESHAGAPNLNHAIGPERLRSHFFYLKRLAALYHIHEKDKVELLYNMFTSSD
jgi:hypothetical protein